MLPEYELPARTRLACMGLKWFAALTVLAFIGFYLWSDPVNKMITGFWETLTPEQQGHITYSDGKKLMLKIIGSVIYFSAALIGIGAFRLFSALQKGYPFAVGVAKAIRFLGLMILTHALALFLARPVMIGAMTFDNPPGERLLSLAAGTNHATLILLGATILILGHIFTEAVRMSDENRQFV